MWNWSIWEQKRRNYDRHCHWSHHSKWHKYCSDNHSANHLLWFRNRILCNHVCDCQNYRSIRYFPTEWCWQKSNSHPVNHWCYLELNFKPIIWLRKFRNWCRSCCRMSSSYFRNKHSQHGYNPSCWFQNRYQLQHGNHCRREKNSFGNLHILRDCLFGRKHACL